jgi:hypothetical protein
MLPQFILVGPKRTATTWLHRVLAEQVCFPAGIKETMFFDVHYARGLRWYESHFSHCDSHCIAAESAPSYFHSQPAIERISRHIPECRIICTLRDPVERLYSLYRLMREYGETQLPFEDALQRVPHMLESSRYSHYVRRWYAAFGRERVLVVVHDDLDSNPQNYLDRLCGFIGIPSFLLPGRAKVNEKPRAATHPSVTRAGQYVANALRARRLYWPINCAKRLGFKRLLVAGGEELAPVSPATEASLRERFRREILELQDLTAIDLTCWLGAPDTGTVVPIANTQLESKRSGTANAH